MSHSQHASIIVPTFREAANLTELTERLFKALPNADAELIIVDDDSRDGTDQIAESLSARYPLRLIVRKDQRGLSSAVLTGFKAARYDRFVVLDADLQHPPEAVPRLLAELENPDCEFVIATRYAADARLAKDWPLLRRLASRLATALARPLAPLSDPMSGFFAIRRQTWQRAVKLSPIGYKIALELFVKCGCKSAREVPIVFATRAQGESKAGFRVGLRYLQHLACLYVYRFPLAMLTASLILLTAIAWMLFELIARP